MTTLRLPSFWHGMGFTAKAGYLCSSHQAKDYSDACAILRGLKPRKRTASAQPQREVRLPYRDD